MSRARAKGTRAETAVVDYLRQWFPAVERRAVRGARDAGDIAGLPDVVLEVKDCTTMKMGEWMNELEGEKANAGARLGAVWHKRRGKGSPGAWYVTLSGEDFAKLLARVMAPLSRG